MTYQLTDVNWPTCVAVPLNSNRSCSSKSANIFASRPLLLLLLLLLLLWSTGAVIRKSSYNYRRKGWQLLILLTSPLCGLHVMMAFIQTRELDIVWDSCTLYWNDPVGICVVVPRAGDLHHLRIGQWCWLQNISEALSEQRIVRGARVYE